MNLLEKFHNEPNRAEILVWANKFSKADKIKQLAFTNSRLYINNDIMDKRMEKVWNSVKLIEPVITFENGNLTREASSLLTMVKLYKVYYKNRLK